MNQADTNNNTSAQKGNSILSVCIAAYLLYAFFLLIECLDFSALLHSPEPGYHATYDIGNIIFYVIDMIACITFGLILMILNFAANKKAGTVVFAVLSITILRLGLIYYLYIFKEGSYQLTPFIYKNANWMSDFVRAVMLPLQMLAGIWATWLWQKIANSNKALTSA